MKNKLMKKAFAYAAAAVFSAQLFTISCAYAEGCTAEFVFSDTKITADGADGYSVDGTNLKIEKSGTYKVSGSCSDGSIFAAAFARAPPILPTPMNPKRN